MFGTLLRLAIAVAFFGTPNAGLKIPVNCTDNTEELTRLRLQVQIYENLVNNTFTCDTNGGKDELDKEELKEIVKEILSELPVPEQVQTKHNHVLNITQHLAEEIKAIKDNEKDTTDKVAFSVYLKGGCYTRKSEPIKFTGVRTNRGDHYNTATGKFCCPVNGVYSFAYSIYSREIKRSGNYRKSTASLYLSGSVKAMVISEEYDPSYYSRHQAGTSVLLECQAGQEVWLQNDNSYNRMNGNNGETVFSGYLLYKL